MAISEAKVRSKMAKSEGELPGPKGNWFTEHPDALEEVKVWMEMKKNGETEWSLTRLLSELTSEHQFPFRDHKALGSFLRANFFDEYPRKR